MKIFDIFISSCLFGGFGTYSVVLWFLLVLCSGITPLELGGPYGVLESSLCHPCVRQMCLSYLHALELFL